MRKETKTRDVLKSAFKETPESFRNTVNNAISEVVHADIENSQSLRMINRQF